MDISETVKNNKEIRGIFYYPPDDRRCTATSKQTGKRCKRWATKGKKVCYYHGGRSTGPRTTAGIQRTRAIHLKHGEYSLIRLKDRTLERLSVAMNKFHIDRNLFGYLELKLSYMNYQEFRKQRPNLMAFCRGQINMKELASFLDNKIVT